LPSGLPAGSGALQHRLENSGNLSYDRPIRRDDLCMIEKAPNRQAGKKKSDKEPDATH